MAHIGSIERGKKAADNILKKYGNITLSNLEHIGLVSHTWKNRPKSNIVKWLLEQSNTSLDDIARYLGCTRHYLNNKLSRGSFSFDDLLIIAYACGFSITLTNKENTSSTAYAVEMIDFFDNYNNDVLDRIEKIEKEKKISKRVEYEKKKAELEKMKEEYGFDD